MRRSVESTYLVTVCDYTTAFCLSFVAARGGDFAGGSQDMTPVVVKKKTDMVSFIRSRLWLA